MGRPRKGGALVLPVYIGFDRREPEAAEVCKKSLLARSTIPLDIKMLGEVEPRRAGIYDRPFRLEGSQRIDSRDGKPFSTDFSFTRFLVPVYQLYQGWALFVDCDFLFRWDVKDILDLADDSKALMCVKHDYRPAETIKMDGQKQELYSRKNWSSLVLWNCAHPANKKITPRAVNFSMGQRLHNFYWLKDEHIGNIPEYWNWLEGWSQANMEPRAVHMTRGVPTMKGYENIPFADEWRSYLMEVLPIGKPPEPEEIRGAS